MSNQTNPINIEQLVSRGEREFISIEVDILALVQAVTHNVTLVKEVLISTNCGIFRLVAAFGPPETKLWSLTLVAKE